MVKESIGIPSEVVEDVQELGRSHRVGPEGTGVFIVEGYEEG